MLTSPGFRIARCVPIFAMMLALPLLASFARADAGVDFALHKPVIGSALCKASEPASNAVDGTISSILDKFCSLARPAWLQVDLGQVRRIHEFTIRHAGAGGEARAWNTRAFDILASSDGARWQRVVHVVDNTEDVSSHAIAPIEARYVKLLVHVPSQNGDLATRIFELEVR